jgi:hypothetical protein
VVYKGAGERAALRKQVVGRFVCLLAWLGVLLISVRCMCMSQNLRGGGKVHVYDACLGFFTMYVCLRTGFIGGTLPTTHIFAYFLLFIIPLQFLQRSSNTRKTIEHRKAVDNMPLAPGTPYRSAHESR